MTGGVACGICLADPDCSLACACSCHAVGGVAAPADLCACQHSRYFHRPACLMDRCQCRGFQA